MKLLNFMVKCVGVFVVRVLDGEMGWISAEVGRWGNNVWNGAIKSVCTMGKPMWIWEKTPTIPTIVVFEITMTIRSIEFQLGPSHILQNIRNKPESIMIAFKFMSRSIVIGYSRNYFASDEYLAFFKYHRSFWVILHTQQSQ